MTSMFITQVPDCFDPTEDQLSQACLDAMVSNAPAGAPAAATTPPLPTDANLPDLSGLDQMGDQITNGINGFVHKIEFLYWFALSASVVFALAAIAMVVFMITHRTARVADPRQRVTVR